MTRLRSTLLVTCMASCIPAPSGEGAQPHGPATEASSPTDRVAIPAAVRKNLGVTFATVDVRHVGKTLHVPGAFEFEPTARREYRTALAGHVEVAVRQYDDVEPGALLFRYRAPEWPALVSDVALADQAIETARAEIEVAQARRRETADRLALVESRIAALAEADFKKADLEFESAELEASLPRLDAEIALARTELSTAERGRRAKLQIASGASGLELSALEAEVEVDGERMPRYLTIDAFEVRAARPGTVEQLAVTDGAFVERATAVVTVVDRSRVRFRAQAMQADLGAILGATSARVAPPTFGEGDAVEVSVAAGLESHPAERTIAVIATPTESAAWVRAGVTAFLEVVVDETETPRLAVPRAAVVRDGLVHVLFRRNPKDPNEAIRVEADLGLDDGDWVVLESGVMRGDEVVLSGAYELNLAMQQRGGAPKGGHFHADGTFHEDH